MGDSDGLRRYLEEEIKGHSERLEHWARQKAEADEHMEKHRKALDLLEEMLRYVRVGEGEGEDEVIEEEKPYSGRSIVEGAFEVLKRAGRPLHVTRIWEELERGGKTLKAPKPTVSITGALLRDKRFHNVGGNTFMLREAIEDAEEHR